MDDLVATYMLALERNDLEGEVINAGTGESPSIQEIATFIAKRLETTIEHGPGRSGEVMGFSLDSSKARELGFSPRLTFWEGLERYINWKQS